MQQWSCNRFIKSVTKITSDIFSLAVVPIDCFMAYTVRPLSSTLPVIVYSPAGTPPRAVGPWNVTKNCNGQLYNSDCEAFVCKLCGLTTWLPEGWTRPPIRRVTSRHVSSLRFFIECWVILYSGCEIIEQAGCASTRLPVLLSARVLDDICVALMLVCYCLRQREIGRTKWSSTKRYKHNSGK